MEYYDHYCFPVLQVRGSEPTDPVAGSGGKGEGGAAVAESPVAAEGDNVADALARTMRSPWSTPPAVVVDMEPLRDVRQVMIQVRL